ncbi:MAG: ABC transporter ATP-binding protein [Clostridia bacterium]|nr:ABC transporter ATP-binding protein [Clostridia bacterium]
MSQTLVLDRLSRQYGSKLAVDRVSTTLGPGIYGLLGANGAGKTTLMRLICGVLAPTSGEVRWNGVPITACGEGYRDRLGYLPQHFGYYPDFTAEDFLHYLAALKGLPRRVARRRSGELLELVGLEEQRRKKIRTFSGGMKQRLGIAQAMLGDPDILVLDEPTAGLDPKERVRFRNLISTLSADKTVLLSTHIVSDVEYIAHEILLMRAGQLIGRGTIAELCGEIAGKIWSITVGRDSLDAMLARFTVINVAMTEGEAVLRVVSDTQPTPDACAEEARLEDLYLYYFRDGEGDLHEKLS